MRRILVMLTAVIMLFALTACELDAPTNANTKPEKTKPGASVTQPTQTTTKPTTEPTEPTKAPTQPATKPEEPTVPTTAPNMDGMRPEFKAAMDSYETFMAEYCAFMRKYKENPNDLTLLADYAEFMKEYADFAEKMNAWENDELNDIELKYYMDVTTRVAKMLVELDKESGEDDPNLVDGMRPEFKEAMDAYEAFMTEYCEFMKKYKENPSDMSLLTQYLEMMNQYTEATQKLQEWSSDEMNNAEKQYYLDVTNRVSQMLMDAIG